MTLIYAPHEQRVLEEKAELDGRCGKLAAFLITPIYARLDEPDQALLSQQHKAMIRLSDILGLRIARFKPVDDAWVTAPIAPDVCPADAVAKRVEVKFRHGGTNKDYRAEFWHWGHDRGGAGEQPFDIVAYRVVPT